MRKRPRLQNIIILILGSVLLIGLWLLSSRVSHPSFRRQLSLPNLVKELVTSENHRTVVENDVDEFNDIPEGAISYLSMEDLFEYQSAFKISLEKEIRDRRGGGGLVNRGINPVKPAEKVDSRLCQMENCFDFERCQNDFRVYVYPPDKFVPISTTYEKILNRIMSSPYYTTDPQEACLFVLSIDTLDRDSLSHDFVRNLGTRLQKLQVKLIN